MLNLTPTEQRLYDALADGEPHHRSELLLIVDADGLAEDAALYKHVYRLRLKLRGTGEELIAQNLGGKCGYRRILHINYSANSV